MKVEIKPVKPGTPYASYAVFLSDRTGHVLRQRTDILKLAKAQAVAREYAAKFGAEIVDKTAS